MALDTHAGLKAALGDWTGRKLNSSFNVNVPDFIRMAESRIFYGSEAPMESPPVRVLDMERTKALPVVNGIGRLPVGFLEFKRVYWGSGETLRLNYVEPREFWSVTRSGEDPECYTVEGGNILISPAVSGSVNGSFYLRYDALDGDDDTNWLMQNAPAIYLQAALVEAWGWIGNGERQQAALATYRSSAAALNKQRAASRIAGAPLRIRGNMW